MTITLERPRASAVPEPPRRRRRLRGLIPVTLILVGVGVFLYPVLATLYNNDKQSQAAQRYSEEVAAAPDAALAGERAAAQDYNTTLGGVPILDPWLTKAIVDPSDQSYKSYLGELSEYSAMARLRIPVIGVDLPVYHGTSDHTLSMGVGHLYGTSLPVGGIDTHSVLTSHTGLSTSTLFDHLTDMVVGDRFFVDVLGQTLTYEVDQIKVVLPNEISELTKVAGQDYVTLVTCTPYAVNTHRLLVRGHRIPTEQLAAEPVQQQREQPSRVSAMQSWMYWLLAGAAAGVLAILAIGLLALRRRRRARRLPSA